MDVYQRIAQGKRIKSLIDAGKFVKESGDLLGAAGYFYKALELAEEYGETDFIVTMRYQLGHVLTGAGKMKEGLAAMTPILQSQTVIGKPSDFYWTLIRYIETALEIPANLQTIEKVFGQIENLLSDSEFHDWPIITLWLRAALNLRRGLYQEALNYGQESWALREQPRREGDLGGYSAGTHLGILVESSLRLNNLEQVKKYLLEMESRDAEGPSTTPRMLAYQSSLARIEGRKQDTIEWTRQALVRCQLVTEQEDRYLLGTSSVRACLYTKQDELLKEAMSHCVRLRSIENGHYRFGVRLLIGDYHLAYARRYAGMEPVDDEYGESFPMPITVVEVDNTRRRLIRARLAYNRALTVGKELDEKLQCSWRQREISNRFERIEAIWSKL